MRTREHPIGGRQRHCAAGVIAVLLGVTFAGDAAMAQSIGLYTAFDAPPPPEGQPTPTHNELVAPPLTPAYVYIVAHLTAPNLQAGITAAEFALEGVPQDNSLIVTCVPNPMMNVEVGVFFAGGVSLGFQSCLTPDANQAVVLYSLELFPTRQLTNHTLRIVGKDPPSEPAETGPWLHNCDLVWSVTPAVGVPLVLNPTVAIESRTWSAIRQQYR